MGIRTMSRYCLCGAAGIVKLSADLTAMTNSK
jgi:hypothetical protein